MKQKRNNVIYRFLEQLLSRVLPQNKQKKIINDYSIATSQTVHKSDILENDMRVELENSSSIITTEIAVTAEAPLLIETEEVLAEINPVFESLISSNIEVVSPDDSITSVNIDIVSLNEDIVELSVVSVTYQDRPEMSEEDKINEETIISSSNQIKYNRAYLEANYKDELEIKVQNMDSEYLYLLSEIREIDAWAKLYNRIIREFQQVNLLSDIQINDDEYGLLIKDFRKKYKLLHSQNNHELINPIYAVELVQIGIHCYDGRFWSHINHILGIPVPTSQHSWFKDSFINTLKVFGKPYYQENELVANILMHCFICDYYLDDFFEYLFQYYHQDLERDFNGTDNELDFICNSIINPYSKRKQMLSNYSGLSMRADRRYCQDIVKKLLYLIDCSYWQNNIDKEVISDRYAKQFYHWRKSSPNFLFTGDRVITKNTFDEKVKKHRMPYLKCDLENSDFYIVLPPQLILEDLASDNEIRWVVERSDEKIINAELQAGFSGMKTKEVSYLINAEDIFRTWKFALLCGEEILQSFKWKERIVQFFDEQGNWLKGENLPIGTIFAFSKPHIKIKSEAILDSYIKKSLKFYQLELNKGDLIQIEGGVNYYIGDIYQEGLTDTDLLKGICFNLGEAGDIPVYIKQPALILAVKNDKFNGTAVYINRRISRLSDNDFYYLSLGRETDYKYYYLSLGKLDNINEGINEVVIDVPGGKYSKSFKFIYLKDLKYGFEDAPYIFQSRGTLYINRNIDKNIIRNQLSSNNMINFALTDMNGQYLEVPFIINNAEYLAKFEVPVLLYSNDGEKWDFNPIEDIWHSEFESVVYLKYPEEIIEMAVSSINEKDVRISFKKSLQGYFKCDMTKFKSYFYDGQMIKTIKFLSNGLEYPLFRIITKSYLAQGHLEADYEKEVIHGIFDIVGKGIYYADLFYDKKPLAEKIAIHSGRCMFNTEIQTGVYRVDLFEGADEFGFEDIYTTLGTLECELINPTDLTNKMIVINSIQSQEYHLEMLLDSSYQYLIVELQKVDAGQYMGKLLVVFREHLKNCVAVTIRILNLNSIESISVSFIDEYEEESSLLYDNYKRIIVENENPKYSKTEAYRRYDVIDQYFTYQVEYQKINSKYLKMAQTYKPFIRSEMKINDVMIWKDK